METVNIELNGKSRLRTHTTRLLSLLVVALSWQATSSSSAAEPKKTARR